MSYNYTSKTCLETFLGFLKLKQETNILQFEIQESLFNITPNKFEYMKTCVSKINNHHQQQYTRLKEDT